MSERRVVITGMGVVSPVGNDLPSFWESLKAGRSGITRYTALNLSSNAFLELQWYLFSAIFLLGGAYTLKRDEHVRVDVFHAALHPRRRAKIDLAGTIVFLIPFCLFVLWTSWAPVVNSWRILERSPDPGGLPRYPVKMLIPLGFVLVFLQAMALLIRRWAEVRERRDG